MQLSVAVVLAAVAGANAHYALTYPEWRGDSYKTQWNYPCGGVDSSNATRTLWPLDGGAIAFEPGHEWAQTQINIGLGEEVTSFRHVLWAPFNQTGNGTFCFEKATIPEAIRANITEGTKASIQVIQIASNGAGLFNCADIEFSGRAVAPSESVCFNSTGVSVGPLNYNPEPAAQCDNNGGSDDDDDSSDGNGNEGGNNGGNNESAGASTRASMAGMVIAAAGLVAGLIM